MESDNNDTSLSADTFWSPAEIARIKSQSSEFSVSSSGSNKMDALVSNTSVGRLTTFLECSAVLVRTLQVYEGYVSVSKYLFFL